MQCIIDGTSGVHLRQGVYLLVDGCQFALKFSEEWQAAWISHDVDRVLAPYADDVVFQSPYVVHRFQEPTTEVREPGKPAAGGSSDAVVEITFAEGFPTNDYGLDVCDIGDHDGIVRRIKWLVDLDTDEVLAVTPVWGSVSCLDV